MKKILIIISIPLFIIIILFLYCSLKLAKLSDEFDKNI